MPPNPTATPQRSADGPRAPLRLLLVDDHVILRRGLRALLELESDLLVVGEAGSCEEALELAQRLQPDIALTDIGLPGRSGLALVGALRAVVPRIKVLLLTAHGTEEYIRAGLDASADGYVLKDAGAAELLLGIRTVAGGQQYLCKAVTTQVLRTYLGGDAAAGSRSAPHGLTERECQVLARIAAGRSNKAIARELALSTKTVEKHRSNLMRKLGLHNAAAVTRFALAHDIVATDPF
jgi:DNA-binding NarL/FixJ family response regulator